MSPWQERLRAKFSNLVCYEILKVTWKLPFAWSYSSRSKLVLYFFMYISRHLLRRHCIVYLLIVQVYTRQWNTFIVVGRILPANNHLFRIVKWFCSRRSCSIVYLLTVDVYARQGNTRGRILPINNHLFRIIVPVSPTLFSHSSASAGLSVVREHNRFQTAVQEVKFLSEIL